MAKVVLVWNEHPTEVVAGFHARKVAKILKERYGHEVIVRKIPIKETNYWIFMHHKPIEAIKKLAALMDSYSIAEETGKKEGAIAFNFHSTPAENLGSATELKPEEFRIGKLNKEITINKIKGGTVVETPAFFEDMPKGNAARRSQLEKLSNRATFIHTQRGLSNMRHIYTHKETYFLRRTPLKHPQQQKYLHPEISEKIAAAIHERITRK